MNGAESPSTAESQAIALLLQQAEAATSQNRQHEARRLLKAALRHDYTNARALISLVYLAEDGHASLSYLTRLLDAHPDHPQARTAIRWVQRRIPTSGPSPIPVPLRKPPAGRRHRHHLAFGLPILVLLLIPIALWQLGRSPSTSVQAEAPWATLDPLSPSPTPHPLMKIVRISIPLFTLTPTPTPTPLPTPTPTPSSAWVPAIGHPQAFNLSCESRSASDLAAHWGVRIDEAEFFSALGQSDNPHAGFVGDVTDPPGSMPPYGYGVYAEPVAVTLRAFGLDARPVYELGLDGLRAEILAGRPVLVWATYGMERNEPQEWISTDGRVSTVVPFMHTFLVTGYDEHGLSVLDAYDATIQYYAYDTFRLVWDLFDQMALIVTGPLAQE